MRDFMLFIFIPALIAFILLFSTIFWFKSSRCEAQSISFQDSNFTILAGCMVNHKGRWLPLDNIRGFDDKG